MTLDELVPLHHYGKITDLHYTQGYNSFVENGFAFPFFFWEHEGKKYIIDGHGRKPILLRMKEEGVTIPDSFPADPIFADSQAQAKKLIIAQESRYKDILKDEFSGFLAEDGLVLSDVEEFMDIPDLDLGEKPEKKKGSGDCTKCKFFHARNHEIEPSEAKLAE